MAVLPSLQKQNPHPDPPGYDIGEFSSLLSQMQAGKLDPSERTESIHNPRTRRKDAEPITAKPTAVIGSSELDTKAKNFVFQKSGKQQSVYNIVQEVGPIKCL